MTRKQKALLKEALTILNELGLPRDQQNERSAFSLLALLDLSPEKRWADAGSPMLGITPIMDWMSRHYDKDYKPNTRETVRRQTMHQFVEAGLAVYNPDKPDRPVNSPHAVYQISPEALALLKGYGTENWSEMLTRFLHDHPALARLYASPREVAQIPVHTAAGKVLSLSPGKHSELIKAIIEDFGSRFVPGGLLIYVGDTGEKWQFFDKKVLGDLGVIINEHGKMPDVILYCQKRNWLILAEAVTSHGPVDGKRHDELSALFKTSVAGLVYLTAFPDRATMGHYLGKIAWETEVWVADAPSHLIHFNGSRFLGPYGD